MNDIVLSDLTTALPVTKPEYGSMLQNIQERMPAIVRDTSNFHKSHSQFMQVALDVTASSYLRTIISATNIVNMAERSGLRRGASWAISVRIASAVRTKTL